MKISVETENIKGRVEFKIIYEERELCKSYALKNIMKILESVIFNDVVEHRHKAKEKEIV